MQAYVKQQKMETIKMSIKLTNNRSITNCTFLVGYIAEELSTKELIQRLGHPTRNVSLDYKVTRSWVLEKTHRTGRKTVATVYDYKSGLATSGNDYTRVQWHIGGHRIEALEVVREFINMPVNTCGGNS